VITYGSVCSGIESASVAWHSLGMRPLWFAEIEKFPSEVLAHRWPEVINYGDMLVLADGIRCGLIDAPQVLVGGTPCQSYSIAGKRLGLEDPRGRLTLAYVDILNAIDSVRGQGDEGVCVWENVPGVLSDAGNAFGEFLAKLAGEREPLQPAGGKWSNAGCVFGPQRSIAWRVIDAQHFGVAQRRRRVYLVASARRGLDPGEILFEFEGTRRDTPPRRETRESNTAHTPTGFRMTAFGQYASDDTASTMKARDYKDATDLVVCFAENSRNELRLEGGDGQVVGALTTGGGKPGQGTPTVTNGLRVRRLMPVECERLQGFDDDYTNIPGASDSARYKALGNSKAVPCIKWIGARLNAYFTP
jgi:DNA (cytosine-5)-methyltransferase 1